MQYFCMKYHAIPRKTIQYQKIPHNKDALQELFSHSTDTNELKRTVSFLDKKSSMVGHGADNVI